MDMIIRNFLCVSIFVFWFTSNVCCDTFNVTDFGAISDGKTDSSGPFVQAWNKACAIDGGGVLVPEGTFFVSNADFEGPCNGSTVFQNQGTIIASSTPSTQDYWLQFHGVDGLSVIGDGTFDGQGAKTWGLKDCPNCNFPPTSLSIIQVKHAMLQGIKSINSKGFHIHIALCDNVSVRDVNINAPNESPNTDGIHISGSNTVEIFHANIATGDDCISIGDGSTNVNISNVFCGPGHGISIGSLGRYASEKDVTGITVRNCTFSGTQNGVRIKTWAPSAVPLTVSDVTFTDIQVDDVENPVIIDQYYCPHDACNHEGDSSIQIQGVKFVNINGTSAKPVGVNIQCSKTNPCKDIEFSGLNLQTAGSGQPTTASCSNADKNFIGTNQVPSEC